MSGRMPEGLPDASRYPLSKTPRYELLRIITVYVSAVYGCIVRITNRSFKEVLRTPVLLPVDAYARKLNSKTSRPQKENLDPARSARLDS